MDMIWKRKYISIKEIYEKAQKQYAKVRQLSLSLEDLKWVVSYDTYQMMIDGYFEYASENYLMSLWGIDAEVHTGIIGDFMELIIKEG